MTQIQFMMTWWWGLHSLGQKKFQNSAHNYFHFLAHCGEIGANSSGFTLRQA